jgi:hypothetical protein
MPYDDEFYRLYDAYLKEPQVRKAHNWVFSLVKPDHAFNIVVDYGCGLNREWYWHGPSCLYYGIDVNGDPRVSFRVDYRTMDLSEHGYYDGVTAFVSLFSSEITAPTEANYAFYERVFQTLPNIRTGLVSGFYYVGREKENPIEEAGGVISYQTLERPEEVQNKVFSEKRIVLPVPSALFGNNVYEVWKIFERR